MIRFITNDISTETFKSGKYLITDLCYVYPKKEWGKYCELIFPSGNSRGIDRDGAVFSYNDIKFFSSGTAYGDGYYPITYKNETIGNCAVDAGCLALVPIELVKSWQNNAEDLIKRKLAVMVEVNNDFVISSGGGDWEFDDYEVKTSDSEEEFEENEEEDYSIDEKGI